MKSDAIIRGDIACRVYKRLGTTYEGVRYDMVTVRVDRDPDGTDVVLSRREVFVRVALPNRPSWQASFHAPLKDAELYEKRVANFLVRMIDQLAEYQPEDRSLTK